VEKIIVAEIDAIFEEGACVVFVYFLDDLVCLTGEEECDYVVVDWVAYLLLSRVAHIFSYIISRGGACYGGCSE
jgi:hypothetical protein